MAEKKHILIVDDDPDFSEATKIVLQGTYQVTLASDGDECLNIVAKQKPDLILLDVMMTKLGEGFDVCRTIKKNPETASVPIIMFTAVEKKLGFNFKSNLGDDQWLPADDYLDKPVDPSTLLEKVARILK